MDEQTFLTYLQAAENTLYHVACTLLRSEADRYDALQDTALRAWQHRNNLRQREYFTTWAVRILINVCRSMARKQGRMVPADTLQDRVAGVRRTTPYGGGTWAVVTDDGSNERVKALCGRFFDLGLCFGFGPDGSDDYMCAVESAEKLPGFDTYCYPASLWLRFEARGRISEGVLTDVWRRINEEFFPQSRYVKCGYQRLPTIEKYVEWDEAADRCRVEIWIPVDERREDRPE